LELHQSLPIDVCIRNTGRVALTVKHWSLTTLGEKLIKIGAKVVWRAKHVTFHMAEVPVPRDSFSIPPLPGFVPRSSPLPSA
jgi:hypothetical protein